MYYVYILQSQKDGSRYVGVSAYLRRRLQEHNNGKVRYSNSKRPYSIIWYCAFLNKVRAYEFEKYLKSGSWLAFRNKHLI